MLSSSSLWGLWNQAAAVRRGAWRWRLEAVWAWCARGGKQEQRQAHAKRVWPRRGTAPVANVQRHLASPHSCSSAVVSCAVVHARSRNKYIPIPPYGTAPHRPLRTLHFGGRRWLTRPQPRPRPPNAMQQMDWSAPGDGCLSVPRALGRGGRRHARPISVLVPLATWLSREVTPPPRPGAAVPDGRLRCGGVRRPFHWSWEPCMCACYALETVLLHTTVTTIN